MRVSSLTESDTKRPESEVPQNVTVRLDAVYSDDKASENYSFSEATPSAQVVMTISNPDAFQAFELNKEYYVDFTEAPAEVPAEPAA